MKYLFALLMSFAVLAPSLSEAQPVGKPKMLLAKKKVHKTTEVKPKKATSSKTLKK